MWVTHTPPTQGTTQGSRCLSLGMTLMLIPTPHGFAVLLPAQHSRGHRKFVQVQGTVTQKLARHPF